ncbi:MAG: hypothetical protein KAI71_00040 [Candidatus Pacebacteria bacterium]|nr:hypothetical protein [Candidatus Paceibacterota bacterium]
MINSNNQSADDNAEQYQSNDNSVINVDKSKHIHYGDSDKQEKKDFGIIEEIFKFLFTKNLTELNIIESTNGKGLKKIPLNFAGNSLQTINEMVMKTMPKRKLVEKFVNDQREIDESKIDALIFKLQKDFRILKESEGHYEEIKSVKIIEQMADNCIDDSKIDNPEYNMNALAIVLYFFEMCDFGKSEEAKIIQEAIF